MLSSRSFSVLLCALALALPVSAAELGQDTNVLVTFEIGTLEQSQAVIHKTYEMIVAADGRTVSMSTGARVPIPTTSFDTSDSGTDTVAPVTSFTYQQIGFSAEVSARFDEHGRIDLRGKIEDSSLTGQPRSDGRPFIQSMQQNLSAKLQPGKPLRINRVDETDVRTFFIQVRADSMDQATEQMTTRRKR